MRLVLACLCQLALCALSFFYLAVLGRWAEALPWRLVFPISLGLIWLALTVKIVKRATSKVPFVLVAVVEFPFAFGWPAWIFLYAFFGH